ncbi:MAG: hypothetical protein NTX70_07040, partial [Verrucomicrobia bacterium]|nr:hypothetical protein [Verrucomicrobiota bacterium]
MKIRQNFPKRGVSRHPGCSNLNRSSGSSENALRASASKTAAIPASRAVDTNSSPNKQKNMVTGSLLLTGEDDWL